MDTNNKEHQQKNKKETVLTEVKQRITEAQEQKESSMQSAVS
jgi:hypothetical protein